MPDSNQQDERRRRAAVAARQWLMGIDATAPSTALQRQMGLGWCSWIGGEDAGLAEILLAVRRIPTVEPLELLALNRDDLLRLINSLAAGDGREWDESKATSLDHLWEPVLGTLAVSSARRGDLLLCAGLLRESASMGLHGCSQVWAECFLLDQQSSSGSFGRLAYETAIVGESTASSVMLTVNVLWSLAAVEQVVRQAHRSAVEWLRPET